MAKTAAEIIDLGSAMNNPLRPDDMHTEMNGVAGAIAMLQTYATLTTQQADLDPRTLGDVGATLMPKLVQHQKAAKRNAALLLRTVGPELITGLTDVIAFSSMVQSFGHAMMPLLHAVTAKPAAREQVQGLLAQLDLDAGKRAAASRALTAKLATALEQAHADSKNLAADYEEAQRVLGTEGAAHAEVQQQIADLRRKISGEIAGVVISALVTTAGFVAIGVGALATLPTGFTSEAVVLAGVGIAAGGIAGLTTAAAALASDNGTLADLYQRSAALSLTLTLVDSIGAQLRTVETAVDETKTALGSLTSEWASIQAGIASFRQEVAKASDASDTAHLTAALHLAQRDWAAISQQAQGLLTRLVELAPRPVNHVTAMNAAA